MDYTILISIAKGLGVGFSAALVGYIKNQPDGEKIDWIKPVPTLIIGAVTGAVAFGAGMPMLAAEEYLASFGIVALVNQLWSAAKKKWFTKKRF